MRAVYNQPFQQYTSNLFLDHFIVAFGKQIKKHTAEVMGMAVWIAQLIGDSTQEYIATYIIMQMLIIDRLVNPDPLFIHDRHFTFRIQFHEQLLINFNGSTLVDRDAL